MPTHNVTVTATAIEYVAGNYVRINSLNQLTDGSKVIIAARYNEENTNGYYAMPGVTSGKPDGVAFTSLISGNDEILPATITSSENTYYWTVNVTENGYTFTNADGQMIGYSSGTNFATNNNTEWTIALETAGNSAMVAEYTGFVIRNGNTDTRAFAFNGTAFGAYSTTNINAPGYNFYLDFFVQPAGSETVTQTTNLVTGWNWFSTYIEVDDPVDMLQAIEASLGENGIMIKNSRINTEYDAEWGWFGDLDDEGIVNEQMYKIQVSAPCTVTVEGTPANPEEHAITVNYGWNWIGFPCQTTITLENAFVGFAQEGDKIRNSATEIVYDPEWGWFGDFETLVPGQGYMYYSDSTTPRRLVFPTGEAKARNIANLGNLAKPAKYEEICAAMKAASEGESKQQFK